MRFASCRIQNDRLLVLGYEKEYNRTVSRQFTVISFDEAAAGLAPYDYLDVIVPAREILRFAGNYPPVKRHDLEKIVMQDIESVTSFKGEEIVFDVGAVRTDGMTPVFIAPKEKLRALLDRTGAPIRDRIRSLVPEAALVPDEGEETQALFIDDDTTVFSDARGQIVRTIGLSRLAALMRESLGQGKSEEEALQILASARDLTDTPALSEDELLLRKAAERFYHELATEFGRFLKRGPRTIIYFADRLSGNAEGLASLAVPGALVVTAEEALDRVAGMAEGREGGVDLARGEFAYRGGFTFLKRRIISAALLFIFGFVLMLAAFETRLWYLDQASAALDDNARNITKEVLGKEYPSLRQAISVMQKTIGGGGKEGKNDKKLYPYSAVFVMEQVFPAAAFEGSSIEVRDFSFKEGKVKLSGEADSLEHINTMLENLEKLDYVAELNKGQITSRGGKNSFGVGFTFQKKTPKELSKKEQKKEAEKSLEDTAAPGEETPAQTAPAVEPPASGFTAPATIRTPVVVPQIREQGKREQVPWEEEQ